MLVRLDIVLVVVRPVQIDLFAVVGDGVSAGARVAALGYEVAVLPVAPEEVVEAVVDVRLDGVARAGAGGVGAGLQIAPSRRGTAKGVVEGAVGVYRIRAQRFDDVVSRRFERVMGGGLVAHRAARQLRRHGIGQPLRDEPLDGVALVVHNAVDAEIEIGAVELKQLAQQVLKLGGGAHHGSSSSPLI